MNQRDIEQLSAYLDGQLKASDSARLESRLASDPALVAALDALRESRTLLQRLPHRRAPRNFTLTPKMVARKPPLPRSYPLLRFATAAAAFLFAVSFLDLRPLAFSAPASATAAPLLEMAIATESPAGPEGPPTEMALSLPAPEDSNRAFEPPPEPAAKNAGETPAAPLASPLFTPWQIAFGGIALLGVVSMLIIRQLAARKWRAK